MNINEYITQIEGVCGGRPIIRGSRIPVRAIAGCFKLGMTLDEIFDACEHHIRKREYSNPFPK